MSTPEPKTNSTSRSTARGAKRPAPRGTAFYPRKRANAACQVCRARKTKCDNRKPTCSYCLSVGAICNQTAEDLSSFDPASLKILSRLDELEKLVRAQRPSEEGQSRPSSQGPTLSDRINESTTLKPSLTQHPSDVDHGDVTPPAKTDAPLLSVSSGPPERLLQLPVFGDTNIPTPPLIQDPPRGKEAGNPPQSASSGPGDAALFSRVLSTGGVHVLLDRFFEYVHCKNPILEEAATRQLVLSMALEGPSWSSRSCLALIVCALGCIATPFGDQAAIGPVVEPAPAALAEGKVLFEAAQRRMGVLLVQSQEEEQGNNLIAPQCLLLAGLYMMCVLRPFQAWRFFSQALGACQQLGFLQQMYNEEVRGTPVHGSSVGYSSQEQAVYWSAWKSERELRQCLFLPDFSAARDTSHLYPPLFPTPPSSSSDDEVDERRMHSSWLFYLAEISLRRLMSRVSREISTLYSSVAKAPEFPGTDSHVATTEMNATYLARLATFVPEYEEQGRQWAASLPAELSLECPVEYDDVCRFVLRGHYVDYWEALYWPFLADQLGCYTSSLAELSQPPPPTSALSPVQNAGDMRAGNVPFPTQYTSSSYADQSPPSRNSNLAELCLEIHTWRIRVNEPGYRHRHHGTLFLIRGCVRSAIVLLAAALQGINMPVDWSEAVSSVIELLAYWETEMSWLSEWRNFLVSTLSEVRGE